jgi:hypothetical protein
MISKPIPGEPLSAQSPATASRIPSAWLYAAVAAVGACLFAIRLAAPPNLLDQDQERPASYVLDVLKNAHWIYQRDLSGDITSKPPMYTWLCAIVGLVCGRVNLLALYLPGALSAIGTACLLLKAGSPRFGARAAFFGALAVMLTTAGLKEFGLARTDGVFAFTVTAAALLAFRDWNSGGGWIWFWLAAAAATLTKGPLGVLFAANGLLAAWWERSSSHPRPLKGSQLPGIALFILLVGGWFLLAYAQAGSPLVAKMIGKELVAHAVSDGKRHFPGMLFYQPPLYYLGRAAPWSVLAIYGLWRTWKQPAAEAEERRFERFLFCWFLAGLFLMSMAPHQRADLLWPLMPAGALIAGRELDRLTRKVRPPVLKLWVIAVVGLAMGGFSAYYFGAHARHPLVQRTVALKELAGEITRRGGEEFPLSHIDDPMTLQIYLNTLRPQISYERAAELLRGPDAAFIVVSNLARLQSARMTNDPPIYELEPPRAGQRRPERILGNRPALAGTGTFALLVGPLWIRSQAALLVKATEYELCFKPQDTSARVIVVNESSEPRKVRICGVSRESCMEHLLGSQESWTLNLGEP